MKKLFMFVLLVLFAGTMVSANSFAQEGETILAYGEVVSVSGNSITINEVLYDEDTDIETFRETTYTLSADATINNVGSLEEIDTGKEVDIEYRETDGGKQATNIYVYTEDLE
jgi:hypothetical protein